MSAIRKVSAGVAGAALLLGGISAPALATPPSAAVAIVRTADQAAQEALSTAVTQARTAYAVAIAEAKAERKADLVGPKAERAVALSAATTKAERRLAKRQYARAAAPIQDAYASAKSAAAATRDAAIEVALATYLAATGRPELATALRAYRDATAQARATLALALQTARATYRTDTADERELLMADLELAETATERQAAWQAFLDGSQGERKAQQASVRAARSTYFSAMRIARATFKADTGVSIRSLMRQAFGN